MRGMKRRIVRAYRSLGVRHRFYAGIPPEGRVLDLGCGAGFNGRELREIHPGVEVVGVDLRKDAGLPPFYVFHPVDLDGGSLPFPDACFDAVLFTHVIEHLRNPLAIGPEIGRVMNPGGRVYIEAPNWTTVLVPSFSFRREQHNPFNFYDDPSHGKPWSKHGLFEYLLQGCGLGELRVGTVRTWLWVPLDPLLMAYGAMTGNRSMMVSAFWNLYGWCIYGVGVKRKSVVHPHSHNNGAGVP